MVLDLAKFLANVDYTQPPLPVITGQWNQVNNTDKPNNVYDLQFTEKCWPVWSSDIVQMPMSVTKQDGEFPEDHWTVMSPVGELPFFFPSASPRVPDGVNAWAINVNAFQVPLANGLVDRFYLGIQVDEPSPAEYFGQFNFNRPRTWQGYDLAEILFSFLVFNTGATTDDERTERKELLNSQSLFAYSEEMAKPHKRQLFSIIRKIKTKLVDQYFGLVRQSYGMITWDHWNSGLRSAIGVIGHTTSQDATTVIDLDIGETAFQTTSVTKSKKNEEYVMNGVETTFGGGLLMLGIWHAPALDSDITDLYSANLGDNVINLNNESSQTTFGVRDAQLQQEDITDQLSQDGDFDLGSYAKAQQEITFSHGLPAFDYSTGDIIHVKNTASNLDGTEDILVLTKEIDLDSLVTTTTGIVRDADPVDWTIDPASLDPESLTMPLLQYWFDATKGVTDTAGAVDQWDDQTPRGNDATGAGATRPFLTSGFLNGNDVINFSGTGNFLNIANTDITAFDCNITVIALINPSNPGSAATQTIWGMDGSGSGGNITHETYLRTREAASTKMGWWDEIDNRRSDLDIVTGWQIVVYCAYGDFQYTYNRAFPFGTQWGTDGASFAHIRRLMMDGTGTIDSYLGPREGRTAAGNDLTYPGRLNLNDGALATLGNSDAGDLNGLQGYMAELQLYSHQQNGRQFSNMELNGLINDIKVRWGLS